MVTAILSRYSRQRENSKMLATDSQDAPPHIASAIEQIKSAIRSVDGRSIDELTTPWAEIEKSIIKLLGGAFRIDRADHQTVALGLDGMYAARLIQEHQAFWFPNREALEGAALGFPEALLVVSPFGAVAEALSRGDLPKLDAFASEIAASLAQARFSATGSNTLTKLGPDDYHLIFYPTIVPFLAVGPTKATTPWAANSVLLLFVDLIPYQRSAPEDGPLGAFGARDVSLLDPAMPPSSAARLVKVDPKRLAPLLNALQPGPIREAVNKFTRYLEQKGNAAPVQSGGSPLLEPALNLLQDLQKLWSAQGGSAAGLRPVT